MCCEEIKIERIGCPRSHGGLGINGLSMFNDAFLAKWMWNLFRQIDSLWSKVLISKYDERRNLVEFEEKYRIYLVERFVGDMILNGLLAW